MRHSTCSPRRVMKGDLALVADSNAPSMASSKLLVNGIPNLRLNCRLLAFSLLSLSFTVSETDASLFIHQGKDGPTYVLVYVDDLLIASSPSGTASVVRILQVRNMGSATFVLGSVLCQKSRRAGYQHSSWSHSPGLATHHF